MKKVIRDVDPKRGIVQVTCSDERWYLKSEMDEVTGLPHYKGVPSVTWVAGYYPKGIAFYKWLADKGWDEAEAIKQAAGDKGSAVHLAIEKILRGDELRLDTKIEDKSRSSEKEAVYRELTLEEVLCIKSFLDWYNDAKPEIIASESVVFSDKHNYAGTVDLVCRVGGQLYVIDFKTSKSIWREYELQVSAYRHAFESGENPLYEVKDGKEVMVPPVDMKSAILQLGYDRNKAGWKFTEIEDKFDLFLTAQKIWKEETEGQDIKVLELPLVLSPGKDLSGQLQQSIENSKPIKKTTKK